MEMGRRYLHLRRVRSWAGAPREHFTPVWILRSVSLFFPGCFRRKHVCAGVFVAGMAVW
ncbi:hypothetical protein IF1G_08933 [Cordyceps javanica]|uniref:Uncharacterized protein n=1 Tax=Cordyceps javanica TaxID=43265 RepID=A0A545VRI1_9HYPO|nr:hypothetical protein IF1G_08933 [Cordyceps javanica]TQW04340.1 hypothetical protein IF2G_08110 [Cordyceps javanica]